MSELGAVIRARRQASGWPARAVMLKGFIHSEHEHDTFGSHATLGLKMADNCIARRAAERPSQHFLRYRGLS